MQSLSLFFLTAGLTLAALGMLLPPVEEDVVREKLAAFAELGDEYDVLALGSSQTWRGLVPERFDETAAAAGLATRTFNLGIPGATLAEQYHYLEAVAALEPRRLRWVLVEAERVMRVDDQEWFLSRKNIAWRDAESTALFLPYVAELDEPAAVRLGAAWRGSVAFCYHLLGVGRGLPWLEGALGVGPSAEERAGWAGARRDGHQAMEDSRGEGVARRRAQHLEQPGALAGHMHSLREGAAGRTGLQQRSLPFYARLERLARSMGAQVVFFTIRRGGPGSEVHALAREGLVGPLVEFEPERFPELYEIEFTYDGRHFNRLGASLFTEHLAERFVELTRAVAQ